jgi:hypothetical protein
VCSGYWGGHLLIIVVRVLSQATFNGVSHRRLGKRGSNKMYYLHLRAKGESPEQETRPYTRRRRGEADDMSHLAGGNGTSGGGRNMVGLVCDLGTLSLSS